MGLVKRKIVFFYDFLPRSTTFVLWRTAKTWMQPSTKTKDTSEPSNETVFDEKTVHGRKQMYKWECKAARRAFFCTTSQALRASSPGRKDSLRPEGDVANSDRGRTTTGESVVVVLDEQSFLQSGTAGLRGRDSRMLAQRPLLERCPAVAVHSGRAQRFAPNWAHADSRTCPSCQGLPYQGSWHREAMTERFIR